MLVRTVLAAFAAMFGIFVISGAPAKAATINFSGSESYDMGVLPSGQNGVILEPPITSQPGFLGVQGLLSNDSKVTFTYSLLSNHIVPDLGAVAAISPLIFTCLRCSVPRSMITEGYTGDILGNPMPINSSLPNLPVSGGDGFITLGNVTGDSAAFGFELVNIPNGEIGVVTYTVDPLPSPVPLPSTFPLLGSAILCLAGLTCFRSRRARGRIIL